MVDKPDWMSVSQIGTVRSSPTLVNETTYHTQYFPKVAALEDGSFVVAWSQSQDASSFAVGYQRYNSEGEKIGSEELISTSNDPVDTLTISPASGNGFKLFVERTGEEFEIANQHDIELGARIVDPETGEFVTPLEVRDNSQIFLKKWD